MPAEKPSPTETEEALEDAGVTPTQHYSLRADQLADGAFHYALEETGSGRVLAEAMSADDHEARSQFINALARSGLSPAEIEALQAALARYDRRPAA
jgi:hypothetical protein